MKLTLHNTDKIVHLDGVPARVWEGVTEKGIPVHCFVTRIAVRVDADCSDFERELKETPVARASEAWPARMALE